jgi:hypothetical protein
MSMQFYSFTIFGTEVNHLNILFYAEHKLSAIRHKRKDTRTPLLQWRRCGHFPLQYLNYDCEKKYVCSYLAIWDYTSLPLSNNEACPIIRIYLANIFTLVTCKYISSSFFCFSCWTHFTYVRGASSSERYSRYQWSSRSIVPAYLRLLLQVFSSPDRPCSGSV